MDQFHLIHSEKAEHRVTSTIAVNSNSKYLLIKREAPHTASANSSHAVEIISCGSPSYVLHSMYHFSHRFVV